MTSRWSRVGLALVLAGMTQISSAAIKASSVAKPTKEAPSHHRTAVEPKKTRGPDAPAAFRDRIRQVGRAFKGRVGIAVRSVDEGWETGWRDEELFPQQSVSKLWVAIAVLDAVDRGKLSLDDKVTLTRSDLTLFHQPIRDEILKSGSYTTTLGDLLTRQITTSDNTANDKLMRTVGGPAAIRTMIARKHLGSIRFANGERLMQSKIAGLTWKPEYSIGDAFWTAREKVPIKKRSAAFAHYIADPYDGAAPAAIVNALARLARGELLSQSSTHYLLDVMSHTHTGPNRLHGGLDDGWTLNHKTGTGQELGGVQAGYNDVGIVTAPDGRSYSVAVMIKKTSTPLSTRMNMMHQVVQAVIDEHDRTRRTASVR